MRLFSLFLLLFLVVLISTPVFASDVGIVKNVEGSVWVVRSGQRIEAVPGTRLMVDDIMKTGNGGAMGIILRDDTIISMGPGSELVLAEFQFQPEENRFTMLTKFVKGTFSYLSGVMAKLSPESVKVETPVGMVAIRGTHFLIKVE